MKCDKLEIECLRDESCEGCLVNLYKSECEKAECYATALDEIIIRASKHEPGNSILADSVRGLVDQAFAEWKRDTILAVGKEDNGQT